MVDLVKGAAAGGATLIGGAAGQLIGNGAAGFAATQFQGLPPWTPLAARVTAKVGVGVGALAAMEHVGANTPQGEALCYAAAGAFASLISDVVEGATGIRLMEGAQMQPMVAPPMFRDYRNPAALQPSEYNKAYPAAPYTHLDRYYGNPTPPMHVAQPVNLPNYRTSTPVAQNPMAMMYPLADVPPPACAPPGAQILNVAPHVLVS